MMWIKQVIIGFLLVDQLKSYMDKMNEEKGYLLTFDFRKNPEIIDPHWREVDEKLVFEVMI